MHHKIIEPTACTSTAQLAKEKANCLNEEIKSEEVFQVIRISKSGKASGLDGFSIDLLKCCASINVKILQMLTFIFNSVQFPKLWSKGLIIPLHKSGSECDPKNYRGITLLPIVAKIYSKVLANRLSDWCICNNILAPEQFGFRPDHQTTDAIFILQTLIERAVSKNEKLLSCFIDFTKAFDSIPHQRLWFKLGSLGIHGNFLQTLQSMYSEASASVFWNNSVSEEFSCNSGVRQGCGLSPILFSLYINSILNDICVDEGIPLYKCIIRGILYADDVVIFAKNHAQLQQIMFNLESFSFINDLAINTSKCDVMWSSER